MKLPDCNIVNLFTWNAKDESLLCVGANIVRFATARWASLCGNRKPVWRTLYLLIEASINLLSSSHHVIRIMFM